MKFDKKQKERENISRTPQGVRGLKFRVSIRAFHGVRVAPRKGCVD